jgi:hypothetical protein
MWDLETSQRVEYPVEGRKCVSFTMRLSLTGMALRTAQQLEVDADALFSIQLVGMDPTKPVVVAGRVTKREQDKAWVQFSPEQSSVNQLHEWIKTKVVPEMEKALATGTMCVTRIHGLTDFVSDFLPIKGAAAAAPAASATPMPTQPAKPDPRLAELKAELEAARRESLDLTEKLAAAEVAAALAPDPIEDFTELADANKTDMIRRPANSAAQDNALTPANLKAIAQRHYKPIAAVAGVCVLLGAIISFGLMSATAPTGPCTAGAADANSTAQQAKGEIAPANVNATTTATTAPKPTVPAGAPGVPGAAPAAAPTPGVAPTAPSAAPVAAAAPTQEAAPELASPEPVSPPVKKPAPAHKSVARGAPRIGSKPAKKGKAVAGDGSKDDAFLDSVFP